MKKLLSACVLALAAVGAYWYFSPYLVLWDMAAAAKAKDADAFNEKVDYPRVRESLKGQFSAQMAKKIGEPSSNPFSALGTMIGMAMVGPMVDALVRPEMVMQMMKEGKVKTNKPASEPAQGAGDSEPQWVIERRGVDRVIATPQKGAASAAADDLSFVFERSGFATWKVTEIRINFDGQ